MFLPTIRGKFMDIQLTHGRGGIRIPEYGMAGRSFPSESASESVFSAALDGVGDTGVLIGITVTMSSMMEGAPGAMRLAGFGLAGGAIWLIAAGESPEKDFPETKGGEKGGGAGSTMGLAVFAGVAFGIYFVALKLSNPLGLVMPMTIARMSSVVLCSVVLAGMGMRERVSPAQPTSQTRDVGHPGYGRWLAGWGWACGVALLDTGGNLLFLVASRMGRLDVASVLASLYPAGTILLAAWYLHERPTRRQGVGMVTALAAVAMITL